MARIPAERQDPDRGGRRSRLGAAVRYTLVPALALGVTAALIAGWHRTEEFLLTDARFILPRPVDIGEESPNVFLHHVTHAPRKRIGAVFEPDYGRSIYLVPLEERRRNLLAIEWVKEASVRRTWPNRIDVHVVERQPVAFLTIPSSVPGQGDHVALIDAEGVVLPPAKAKFPVPVITGIRATQATQARRDAVRRVLRLLSEIGPLAAKVSEIDASDPMNIRIIEQHDDRAYVLLVGNRRFRQRLENFHANYGKIRSQLADASVLDLRMEDRITAVEGVEDVQ